MKVKSADSENCFMISKSMLAVHTPDLEIKESENELCAHVNAGDSALWVLAQWLEDGILKLPQADSPTEELKSMLKAYTLGHEVGCNNFMDAMLDATIQRMEQWGVPPSIFDVLHAFNHEFSAGANAWRAARFCIVRTLQLECDNPVCNLYEALSDLKPELVEGIATTVADASNWLFVNQQMHDMDFCKTLILGFHQLHAHTNRERRALPWPYNRCIYHRHGLNVPCYKMTRRRAVANTQQ